MRLFIALTLGLFAVLPSVHGSVTFNGVTYESVLVPVFYGPTPGAFGSLWTTEVILRNNGDTAWSFPALCGDVPCGGPDAPFGNGTATLKGRDKVGLTGGALYRVEEAKLDNFSFSLHAVDLSRQALTWGTEIPVVRERHAYTRKIVLLNVPLDERFRQMLRVYDFDARSTSAVHVRVYPMHGDDVLADREVLLTAPTPHLPLPTQPGYAELGEFSALLPEPAPDRVRIEIEPITEGLRFWAFVSITNNETQHITTITPQP